MTIGSVKENLPAADKCADMDFRNKRLSIAEAKEIDMVQFLSTLGYEPQKIRNNEFWYCSPLREEKTHNSPSI